MKSLIETRCWRALALVCLVALAGCNLSGNKGSIDTVLTPTDGDVAQTADGSEETQQKYTFDALRKADPQARIGAAQHPKILAAYGGAYENEELEKTLALITGRLVAQSSDAARAYDITVLDSPTVNAFALPGGYLYITRGLLALANDSSEVAAVLAHEMAHVSANHGIDRARANKAQTIAERVANTVVSNPVAGQVVKASSNRRLAAFSQQQELEADAIGIRMTGQAGFDAYAGARFLESMDRFNRWRSAQTSGAEAEMSSSHPSTPRRVELAKRHARQFGPPGSGERNQARYLRGIDGLLFGEKASEGFVRGQRFAHAKLAITFSVPDGFTLANKAKAVLANGPSQQALRFDAVPRSGGQAAADYLKSGWVNGLDESSVSAGKVNGLPMATGRAAAGDWQFALTVVATKKRFYRFILAAPRSATGVERTAKAIRDSFRSLSQAEVARLKPLRVKVVKVGAGDSVTRLAKTMPDVGAAESLFRALNELGPTQEPKRGSLVKVVR
ncbi:MAG: M48 family metalloprotease [Pseudomonadota bacterium]